MKKILLYIIPFIAAILLFAGLVFFLNLNTGKGALQVTSSPQSDVYLDGKLIGSTPLCKCENKDMISTGEHSLRVIPKDKKLNPYEEKITITNSTLTVFDRTFGEGESASLITLTPIDDKKNAEIMVITFPDKADVFLDDNPDGQSPVLLKDVTESDHELRLNKQNFIEKSLRIRATKGFLLKAVVYLGAGGISGSLPTIEATQAPTPTSASSKVLILDTPTGFLRVRSSSSASTSEIGRVNPGESFELLEEEDGWYKIKLVNGDEGWISAQYAEKQ